MTVLTLPHDFEAWARNEVEAGRAQDVSALAEAALADFRHRRDEAHLEAFRRSLDAASRDMDENGGLMEEEVFEPLLARLRAQG